MNDNEFGAFLDLLMVVDPWPGSLGPETEAALKEFADREARDRGCESWIDAYHRFVWPERPAAMKENEMTIDDIYEEVDQLARAGRFNQIDQRLCGVDVPEVEAVELLAWLTATVPCKTKLESRGAFFENACRSFCVRFGGVGELLAGLE